MPMVLGTAIVSFILLGIMGHYSNFSSLLPNSVMKLREQNIEDETIVKWLRRAIDCERTVQELNASCTNVKLYDQQGAVLFPGAAGSTGVSCQQDGGMTKFAINSFLDYGPINQQVTLSDDRVFCPEPLNNLTPTTIVPNIVNIPQLFPTDVLIQNDGKYLIGGWLSGSSPKNTVSNGAVFSIVRLLDTGVIDTNFGTDGYAIFGEPGKSYLLNAIAINPFNNQIFAVGNEFSDRGFQVVKFKANGMIDSSFGNSGRVTVPFLNAAINGGQERPYDIDVISGTKLLISGGYTSLSGYGNQTYKAVLMLQPTGAGDPTYNQNAGHPGELTIEGENEYDIRGFASAINSDGHVYVVGDIDNSFSGKKEATLSKIISSANIATKTFKRGNQNTEARDLAIQPDKRILVLARTHSKKLIYRFNEDLTLDASFGGGSGYIESSFSKFGGDGHLDKNLHLNDGKILLASKKGYGFGLEIFNKTDGTSSHTAEKTFTGAPNTGPVAMDATNEIAVMVSPDADNSNHSTHVVFFGLPP